MVRLFIDQLIWVSKVILCKNVFTNKRNESNIALVFGGVPERSKGSDCKSDGSAFEGSNPSPPPLPTATSAYQVNI